MAADLQVFVDVDVSLLDNDDSLLPMARESLEKLVGQGYQIILCSVHGSDHAKAVAAHHGLTHLASGYAGKAHSMTAHIPCAVLAPFGFNSNDDDSWRITVESIMEKYGD